MTIIITILLLYYIYINLLYKNIIIFHFIKLFLYIFFLIILMQLEKS